jgi:hypothetical protein
MSNGQKMNDNKKINDNVIVEAIDLTLRESISWMLDRVSEQHGCTDKNCEHPSKQQCVDSLLKSYWYAHKDDYRLMTAMGYNPNHRRGVDKKAE